MVSMFHHGNAIGFSQRKGCLGSTPGRRLGRAIREDEAASGPISQRGQGFSVRGLWSTMGGSGGSRVDSYLLPSNQRRERQWRSVLSLAKAGSVCLLLPLTCIEGRKLI